jgi:hypothetical protein
MAACAAASPSLSFSSVFGDKSRCVVLAVIHVRSAKQAATSLAVAERCGCPGVFLVNHYMAASELVRIFSVLRRANPDYWIGVNFLGTRADEAFGLLSELDCRAPDGLWSDNAMLGSGQADDVARARRVSRSRAAVGLAGKTLYFGGVAHKGQAGVHNDKLKLELVARAAADIMDVVTTTGPATGMAADPEKITRMASGCAAGGAAGGTPLAIASGVSVDNIAEFVAGGACCFIVASSVACGFHKFDEGKLTALMEKARSLALGEVEKKEEAPLPRPVPSSFGVHFLVYGSGGEGFKLCVPGATPGMTWGELKRASQGLCTLDWYDGTEVLTLRDEKIWEHNEGETLESLGITPGNWADVPGVADFGVDELRPGAKDPAALVWLLPQ